MIEHINRRTGAFTIRCTVPMPDERFQAWHVRRMMLEDDAIALPLRLFLKSRDLI
jgi:hypothetical protein